MRNFVFVFATVLFFAGVVPVEAQYGYYRDPVGGLVQGNLNLVHRLHGQLDRANMERQFHNLVFHDGYGYYGYYDNGGAFYAVADRQGRRMSRPVKFGIGGALLGAGLGYGISGSGRGAAIGGAVGGIVGLIAGRDRQSQYQPQPIAYTGHGQLVPAPMPETPTVSEPEPIAEPEPQEQMPQEEFQLSNRTSFSLDVYDGNNFLGRMKPGESWNVDSPKVAFRADARIPNNHGGISIDSADIRATDTGWEFVPPAVVAQGR